MYLLLTRLNSSGFLFKNHIAALTSDSFSAHRLVLYLLWLCYETIQFQANIYTLHARFSHNDITLVSY